MIIRPKRDLHFSADGARISEAKVELENWIYSEIREKSYIWKENYVGKSVALKNKGERTHALERKVNLSKTVVGITKPYCHSIAKLHFEPEEPFPLRHFLNIRLPNCCIILMVTKFYFEFIQHNLLLSCGLSKFILRRLSSVCPFLW